MRQRRLVEVKDHVVFGTKAAVAQVWAACGWQINPAFVERLNLSLRQRVAALGRRSATPGKSEGGLSQQLVLFQGYHNCVLPHASLRRALAAPALRAHRGRTAGYPTAPAQIPACGFLAPGSSVILASARRLRS
jgi:hypothetical protein